MKRRLNLVDIMVVIVVLVIAGIGIIYFMGNQSLGNLASASGKVKIIYVTEAQSLTEDMLTNLKVGDQLVSAGRFQDGKILDIQIVKATDVEAVDGEIIAYELEESRRVIVTIEANANKYGPYIELGGQEIKAGSPYYIKTDMFEAYGNVVNIQSVGN